MVEHGMKVHCRRPSLWLLLLLLLGVTGWCQGQALIDPISRSCLDPGESSDLGISADASRNTYVAGGMLMALVSMPTQYAGFFEFYLCPEEGNTAQEECLVRLPLQLADGSGTRYDLADVPDKDMHEVPLILPDEVTCDTCTLQLRVVMAECGGQEDCKATNKLFCSDIAIRQVKASDKRFFALLGRLFSSIFGGGD